MNIDANKLVERQKATISQLQLDLNMYQAYADGLEEEIEELKKQRESENPEPIEGPIDATK